MKRRWIRIASRALAGFGVVLAVLAVRVTSAAHTELRRGERLSSQGNKDAAILAFRRAARLYVPGNPYCSDAFDRLESIAREAERAGEQERALAAHRAIRGAVLSTRSFYVPHADRLERADRRIAELSATSPRERRAHLARLRAPIRPHTGWILLLLIGWIAWTLGAFAFAQRAIDEEDRLIPRSARIWGTVVVVGFGLFVIGMALA